MDKRDSNDSELVRDWIIAKDYRRMSRLADSNVWSSIEGFNAHASVGTDTLDFLFQRVPEGSTVLELGSGMSTRKLAERYTVFTVEDNEEYLGAVPDATYIHAPLVNFRLAELDTSIKWYDPRILNAELPRQYDALIVDGPDGDFGRYGAAWFFMPTFRTDVPVLVDDMQQPFVYATALMIARKKRAKDIEVHITDNHRVFGWIQ